MNELSGCAATCSVLVHVSKCYPPALSYRSLIQDVGQQTEGSEQGAKKSGGKRQTW